ncbi:DUF6049 family protein, partial [Leucobacter chromiireducens]|uniref:DUF6049 family protein n=1 Tax=Leucobacter chromiireducens TaxID=283877 RepID=UPI0019CF5EB4
MARVPLFRAFTATLLAVGLSAGCLLGIGAAGAQASAGSRAGIADAEGDAGAEPSAVPEEPATLVVAASDPVLRPDTAQLEVSILVRNPTAEELPAGELVVGLSAKAVTEAAELAQPPRDDATTLGTLQVGATQPGKSQALTLTIPRSAVPLTASTPFGVHLLSAELRAE